MVAKPSKDASYQISITSDLHCSDPVADARGGFEGFSPRRINQAQILTYAFQG
jgi:hypothetical protein